MPQDDPEDDSPSVAPSISSASKSSTRRRPGRPRKTPKPKMVPKDEVITLTQYSIDMGKDFEELVTNCLNGKPPAGSGRLHVTTNPSQP